MTLQMERAIAQFIFLNKKYFIWIFVDISPVFVACLPMSLALNECSGRRQIYTLSGPTLFCTMILHDTAQYAWADTINYLISPSRAHHTFTP